MIVVRKSNKDNGCVMRAGYASAILKLRLLWWCQDGLSGTWLAPPPGSVPILQTREWSIAARSLISDER